MKLTERELLYEQYKIMSDDKLKSIINDDSYDVPAKEVAKEILNSDRTEYYQQQQMKFQAEQKQKEAIHQAEQKRKEIAQAKFSAQQADPLYDDIHQIAKDVHFIKTIFAIGVVVSAVSAVITLISIIINSIIN